MARETKEQREMRNAEATRAALLQVEEYRKSVPKRIMDATALAQLLGVATNITLTSTGPSVHFEYGHWDREGTWPVVIDDTLTYETEEWELEMVEERLQRLHEHNLARETRLRLAKDAFLKLTEAERAAVKEFSYQLG